MSTMMRFAGILFITLCASVAYAAIPPDTPSSLTPKVVFRGDASTYNPNYPGYKTGGQSLATGGRYNPNAWEAALQLGLARKYRCGYGAGKTCCAIVQEPRGRSLIVKINDNGPLTAGRIIDLNEKSMQYLSHGTSRPNSGIIKNVSVALLDGNNCTTGPVDEADREKWNKAIVSAPTDVPPPSTYTTASGYPQTVGQAYQSNEPTKTGYPQAFASQQAQPVQQPTQYFNPQSAGTPGSTPSPGSLPLDSSFMANQPEPIASIADRLLDLIRRPSDRGASSGTSTKGITVRAEVSNKKVTIVSVGKKATTTASTTVIVIGQPVQTFNVGTPVAPAPREDPSPLLAMLLRLRDMLSGILTSLQSLRMVR